LNIHVKVTEIQTYVDLKINFQNFYSIDVQLKYCNIIYKPGNIKQYIFQAKN